MHLPPMPHSCNTQHHRGTHLPYLPPMTYSSVAPAAVDRTGFKPLPPSVAITAEQARQVCMGHDGHASSDRKVMHAVRLPGCGTRLDVVGRDGSGNCRSANLENVTSRARAEQLRTRLLARFSPRGSIHLSIEVHSLYCGPHSVRGHMSIGWSAFTISHRAHQM